MPLGMHLPSGNARTHRRMYRLTTYFNDNKITLRTLVIIERARVGIN